MSIAPEATVRRQEKEKELAGSTLKPHSLYQHIILKAHERVNLRLKVAKGKPDQKRVVRNVE